MWDREVESGKKIEERRERTERRVRSENKHELVLHFGILHTRFHRTSTWHRLDSVLLSPVNWYQIRQHSNTIPWITYIAQFHCFRICWIHSAQKHPFCIECLFFCTELKRFPWFVRHRFFLSRIVFLDFLNGELNIKWIYEMLIEFIHAKNIFNRG